ncbi:hypothetical protein C0Q70_04629 [Pomacea canaliculata]|uniref:Uncharacterized protein n=1 Tax=Pomacea canaliculata TaxID=400727 RepID=A0A2T7PIX1_POMCA|nr:uncharacterized protein LOC112559215 [Pomacea canaliculata]PVD33375.1 hypothetical protein C0Q70_04629 [Pomacea canaliculata]
MAAETRLDDETRERTKSALKSGDLTTIPRIVLDDRADTTSSRASAPGPDAIIINSNNSSRPSMATPPSGDSEIPAPPDYVPHRCNSDIGLPTASMPNLALALSLGTDATSGADKLGVYCSPRTTRRSVDLDVGSSRDPCRTDYPRWLEEQTSSLRVLTAGSRVGSAVSLNSVCTAHSVGLLSNDSSDEYVDSSLGQDGSVAGSCSERSVYLRRLMSYPEDKGGQEAGPSPRTSHSLCNLKAAQSTDRYEKGSGDAQGNLTPEQLCLLPSDVDESLERPRARGGKGAGRLVIATADRADEGVVTVDAKKGEKKTGSEFEVYDEKTRSWIVCYGKGSNSMREGRIRRWLQDMDKASD